MLTDENDSFVDPQSLGGKGWAFSSRRFPGSLVERPDGGAPGTTAPRGTSACATSPSSPDCVSCILCDDPNVAACANAKSDPRCTTSPVATRGPGYDGFYSFEEEDFNVRFHRMKRRFGVDPQYPVDRYVRALTERKVPRRDSEHPDGGPYVHAPSCTNPLFAAALPSGDASDHCALPEGSRSDRLVFFALIGGVPGRFSPLSPTGRRSSAPIPTATTRPASTRI